jgi:hypothetical protein
MVGLFVVTKINGATMASKVQPFHDKLSYTYKILV